MNDMAAPTTPQTITIAAPSTQMAEVSGLLAQANAFQVTNDDTAQIAADELRTIKERKDAIEAERVKITKPLHDAKRATDELFKKLSTPLEQAERVLKGKVIAYQDEQERKRREEAARAEEAARKERERLEREAAALEKKGKAEAAAAKREVATMMPTAIPAPAPAAVSGFSTRDNWKGRLKSGHTKRDLIVFVAANPAFDYLLDINESKLNAHAKQCAGADLGIPCIEGWNDKVASSR
jgi:hypothetical protein